MEHRRNKKGGETGYLQENPPTSGILMRNSGSDTPGIELGSPSKGKNVGLNISSTAMSLETDQGVEKSWNREGIGRFPNERTIHAIVWGDFGETWNTEMRKAGPGIEPGSSRTQAIQNCGGRGSVVVRLLASHQGELASIPRGLVAPGFSHLGIVPLVSWFSRGSPVTLALAFWYCSIFTSLYTHLLSIRSTPGEFTRGFSHAGEYDGSGRVFRGNSLFHPPVSPSVLVIRFTSPYSDDDYQRADSPLVARHWVSDYISPPPRDHLCSSDKCVVETIAII
ncbi:hypothetical protein PR048_007363 [Dryococelus australis]|uniref:Uncharacterized protein n=1 Tax=Dryococelus australis TaxID=614101 RepID=A0ABQ9HU21_9NEOP|nr:hypothetical protein PR048_007363 [Dryococelus australis]